MSPAKSKAARLEFHISSEQKQLIQRAAELEGVSLTDFVRSALQRAAEETIRRHNIVELTTRGSVTFVNSLLNSSGPNEELQQAFAEYLRFAAE
ncbi:MAG: DUF1778 domain-containing protein [Nitrolancea sp.]